MKGFKKKKKKSHQPSGVVVVVVVDGGEGGGTGVDSQFLLFPALQMCPRCSV